MCSVTMVFCHALQVKEVKAVVMSGGCPETLMNGKIGAVLL